MVFPKSHPGIILKINHNDDSESSTFDVPRRVLVGSNKNRVRMQMFKTFVDVHIQKGTYNHIQHTYMKMKVKVWKGTYHQYSETEEDVEVL